MSQTANFAAPLDDYSPRKVMLRRALKHRGLMISGAVLLIIVLMALFAPLLSPHDPFKQNLLGRMKPPVFLGGTWANPLGTDALGRDMLSRLLYGARVSLGVGLIAAVMSMIIGTTLGLLAGYFGGRVDQVVQFLINVRLALPAILVALACVSLIGGSLIVVTTVMGLLLWDRFAVVIRSATMQVRQMEYVAAADLLGAPMPRILWKDILPNVANQLIVIASLEMAAAIMMEAGLSFLGLGVQPPTPSWGLMISEGKEMLLFESWMITIPGIALFILVFAINIFGDGLRDVTTPEGRN
ncbi:ABC transporter permease [Ketogulonicigenium vulgare]|uniref:Peptide ABC transporter, permease protein n=1 Tax=Ketogulonicigenium vulgare (strain WSH-001) TaxID=759362 RepID=F9Y905_KETVW|nr:ABC transporter permease [Ketogulonicigenium vulgare]ADO41836.1 dipeptide ABC transporter [Ketogulonicigenium vulgare Y25]AEM40061.1 Peptide ABC transporter, permease protein [Ketogulonicigenium vulgare WSH-001]ALJ80265.1 peptide ABC transporter permease [Ketogulonicigenium vulgare]ANW33121.1 peptide ABC transporter permease [Ketogulonicigenium vulgare]AOZ53759.1 dipeptide ABC transporter [Ketogulonicigenium vulgare]